MSLSGDRGFWKPELSGFRAIDIRCEDCGRTKRMQPREIAGHVASGTYSLVGLGNRLCCSVCRDRGGLGRNVSVFPISRGA